MPDNADLPNQYATGRLVLGVKNSQTSSGLIAWATAQATFRDRKIVVLHTCSEGFEAMPEVGVVDWFDVDAWPSVVDEPANTVAALLEDKGFAVQAVIHVGEPVVGLVSGLQRDDEIAVGHSPGSDWRHPLGSPVVHHLIAASPCPVVIVPRDWKPCTSVPARVVVGWDGMPECENALEWALEHCSRISADLEMVRVVLGDTHQPRTPDIDDALVARVQARADRLGDIKVSLVDVTDVPGGTALALDAHAGCADALVLGAHPSGRLSAMMLWDTAERAIYAASCPIVVVPPAVW